MRFIKGNLFGALLIVLTVLSATGGFFTAQYSVDTALAQGQTPAWNPSATETTFDVDKRAFEGDGVIGGGPGIFTGLSEAGVGYDSNGRPPKDLRLVVFQVIKMLLGLVGTVLVVIMMYAGFLWWSARGSDEKVTKAKSTLRNAVIGLIIILMSYSLVSFLVDSVFYPTGSVSSGQTDSNGDPINNVYGEARQNSAEYTDY